MNKCFSYKIQIHLQLGEDDYDHRIELCEIMSQRVQDQAKLVEIICFSDDSTFYLNCFDIIVGIETRKILAFVRQDNTQFPVKIDL